MTDRTHDPDHGDPSESAAERLLRWRLVLGGDEADGIGIDSSSLSAADATRDRVLSELYSGSRRAGLGGSKPRVARWLGDIRTYFPSTVVQVMQSDAMERLGLREMLLEPEMMAAVVPDVDLVTTLIGLNAVMDEQSRDTARQVIRVVTDRLEERLRSATVQAVSGALDRSARTGRPRPADIDWNRTVAANLRHYQPEYRTVIPERLVGYARRRNQVEKEIILAIDQSGSMAESVVFASVFGAVLASLRSVRTRLVVFDTSVVDLTDEMTDPVDVLFGVQLGGGTDINRAVAYCQSQIERPADTVFVLISDLYEGGVAEELIERCTSIVASGATMIGLLALSDSGAPAFDADLAGRLTDVGVPSFACTPDLFPDLMAAAIERRDIGDWASSADITVHRAP